MSFFAVRTRKQNKFAVENFSFLFPKIGGLKKEYSCHKTENAQNKEELKLSEKKIHPEKKRLIDRLTGRLASTVQKTEGPRRNTHKVRFLAKQEEILEARMAGWSLRQIWEELSKRPESGSDEPEFSGSYDLFLRYCRQYMPSSTGEAKAIPAQLSKPPQPSVPPGSPSTAISGFTYDPKPDPEKIY